jgi:hypothetical protein
MTVDDMVLALQKFQELGFGQRIVTQYSREQLGLETEEILGLFAPVDGDEVVVETIEWEKAT